MSLSEIHRTARERLHRQSGAFDLPSIMIGVAVVAILTVGVLAAIFGVIPWAQDHAAKQDLVAVHHAESAAISKDGSFLNGRHLQQAQWIGQPSAGMKITAGPDGQCYVASTISGSGNKFLISSQDATPRPLYSNELDCSGAVIDPTAPEPPLIPGTMITSWDTTTAACRSITFPIKGNVQGSVYWEGEENPRPLSNGDNTFSDLPSGKRVTATISGTFEKWGQSSTPSEWASASCLISVDEWNSTGTTNLFLAFRDADNLKHVESIPETTTDLGHAFYLVDSDFSLGKLDTSAVKSMDRVFRSATRFNRPLQLDTKNVTTMYGLFDGASRFNSALDFNDTSSVRDMSYMFKGAKSFDQELDLDTASVKEMRYMFREASSFDREFEFDTRSLQKVGGMFYEATSFDQPIGFSSTDSLTDISNMFYGAKAFNHPVEFNTANVTHFGALFRGATSFDQPIDFDTSSALYFGRFLHGATAFNSPLHLSDTSNATEMTGMFSGATRFNQPVEFNTSKVKFMAEMFDGATSFDQPVTFDASSAKMLQGMFRGATSLKKPVVLTNTSSVTDMEGLFQGAVLYDHPVALQTSSVTKMASMFADASSFNSPVTFDDTSNVIDMNKMFSNAKMFNQPLSFDTSSVQFMTSMFFGAGQFNQDLSGWQVGNVKNYLNFTSTNSAWVLPKPQFLS